MKLTIYNDERLIHSDNPRYDSIEGCSEWAKETLRVHSADEREVVYTRDEFENAMTHDPLWNAAQLQMTTEGKMHVSLISFTCKSLFLNLFH